MTNLEIIRICEKAQAAVAAVRQHQDMRLVLIGCAGVALAFAIRYIWERWTFIPRKRHNRVFIERF